MPTTRALKRDPLRALISSENPKDKARGVRADIES